MTDVKHLLDEATREQFAFHRRDGTYHVGLISKDGQWVEVASSYQQEWANRITVVLNHAGNPPNREAIAGALEAEWYNGNLDEHAYDRLLSVLGHPVPDMGTAWNRGTVER